MSSDGGTPAAQRFEVSFRSGELIFVRVSVGKQFQAAVILEEEDVVGTFHTHCQHPSRSILDQGKALLFTGLYKRNIYFR